MIKKALSRRGLLRALPAASIAAPTLAQEVARSGYGPLSGAPPPMVGGPEPYDKVSWLAQQRKRFEDIIAGKKDTERDIYDRYSDNLSPAMHYDGLRSVSPVRRAQMFATHIKARNTERDREMAKFSLAKIIRGEW